MVNPDASLAADDPTAVWDADTLREAGLEDVLAKPESEPPPPATSGLGDAGPSIVAEDGTPSEVHRATMPQARRPAAGSSQEMGWASTIALAVGLGAVVYLAIRLLK